MGKPTVFISYSHKDREWEGLLRPHLGLLEKAGRIILWDDRRIDAGDTWYNEIEEAMANAAVSVCLISADYLDSKFCVNEEIPYLLRRRERDGMILIPVLLRPCFWEAIDWLKPIQMLPSDGRSVAEDFRDSPDVPFTQVARRVFEIVDNPAYRPPAPPPPRWSPPEKVDIRRLPVTDTELFGRGSELAMLDEVWAAGGTHVVSLVAWGGVGKSTLVNKWLERLAAENYRGARRVFGWSFYSQGTGERVTSADLFINEALGWFGDPDPAQGSPWDKGQRLADLVRGGKNLLVLDGLEPLQSDLAYERGKVKDPGLGILLAELARRNPGLCVITTREPVADLAAFPGSTRQEDLERISAEAGRALLRVGGVQGADAELEQAARDFGLSALALSLLAAYLHEVPGHPVSGAAAIPDLDVPEQKGRHARRVMVAFEWRFSEGPEVDLLRILGLFDRPAERAALDAVAAAPPIPGLTGHAGRLSEADWLRLLAKLRRLKLVAPESHLRLDVVDAHPLVREHFGEQLRGEVPAAWREAHGRLFEHYKSAAKEYPDTIEEMVPLCAAVAHGCQAGRYQEVVDEVYWKRIQRGKEFFIRKKLGAYGADLAALSGFFDPPWRRPIDGLTEAAKRFVLNAAGINLKALGRLAEAVEPMQAVLASDFKAKDWKNAAYSAVNLSELALAAGDVAGTIRYAAQSVELADRSGDAFQRVVSRTALADALHQAGDLEKAEAAFRQAEALQAERQPAFPLLYSLQGYGYCDLLLGGGQYAEVQRRASQTLEWAEKYVDKGVGLLDIALIHLSLGRAYLGRAVTASGGSVDRASTASPETQESYSQAATYLDQAVDGLRRSGHQDYLPRGLLTRATLRRVTGAYDRARGDLDEALSIATRGGMRLHEADCHLEYARLCLATGEMEAARDHLTRAKAMVAETGYHRWDGEVAALEQETGVRNQESGGRRQESDSVGFGG